MTKKFGSVDICICTHNPDLQILKKALASIASQDGTRDYNISLVVVDNNSTPAIDEEMIGRHIEGKFSWRVVQEPRLGVSRARLRAIMETRSPWILFVDDDNELHSEYIKNGFKFIEDSPDVGCFGGKLLLPEGFETPDWAQPFLPYLAIKDLGDEVLAEASPAWGPWEPPTAGAWVRRDVAQLYADRMTAEPILCDLGRTGTMGLGSCEDSLMMRGAFRLGLKNAYVPQLVLTHNISPKRINFLYLVNLLAGYGKSQVLLEYALGERYPIADEYEDDFRFKKLIDYTISKSEDNPRYRAARVAWHIYARRQHQLLTEHGNGDFHSEDSDQ